MGIRHGIKDLLSDLGVDVDDQHFKGTPERVEKMFKNEFCVGYKMKLEDIMKTDFVVDSYDQMVLCRGIDFVSLCMHHLLPFYGTVAIGYIPGKVDNSDKRKIVGLSKLGRLVDMYSKRLQIQEEMTGQIAGALQSCLSPEGCGVVVKAKHFCMCGRGVKKVNSEMVTVSLKGTFLEAAVKQEFLKVSGLF
jgi:GTP cyclohydrolase I